MFLRLKFWLAAAVSAWPSGKVAPIAACPQLTELPEVVVDDAFEVVVEFTNPVDAYRTGWYPGAKAHGPGAWGDRKGQRPHMDMKPATPAQ